MKAENLFESIPQNLDKEFFDTLIQSDRVEIERIVSKGHTSPDSGWYDQEKNEWVIVLKGEAIISFEQESDVSLKPGDHINIAAHVRHRVKWTDPDAETVWLAVHY